MVEIEKLKQSLGALPIFPLPTAILLPYEMLPLHVFEPRYRALVKELLEHDRPLGLAPFAPGWEGDYEGRPPVERVCGAGFVVRHEKLPDGRYNILVRGVARVRIESELPPDRPFREVVASLVEDVVPPTYDVASAQESLRRMIFALCSARPGPGAGALAQLAARTQGPGPLADIVIAGLVTDQKQRRRSLVDPDVVARVDIALAAIAELLVAKPGSSEVRYLN